MSFFTPNAAWLFLLAIPLIALYFLKLKRPRITVPSLVLWHRVLDDQRVNSPFQRFKRNLLLLLQLLLLLLIVLAAMQPFFRGQDERVSRLPVMIDCSASMAATTERGGPSRLDQARNQVEDMITGLLPDQQMAIISFSDSARQRSGFTDNKQRLRDAVNEIAIEDVPSDIEQAFRMAQALGRGTAFDEAVLITDGNLPERADIDLPFRVNYQKLESPAPNIGITACTARRGRTDGWEIFVEISASAGADYGGAVSMKALESPNDDPIASELVSTKPGQQSRLLFQVAGSKAQTLTFELVPNANLDALDADNVAYLTLPELRDLQVYVPEKLQAVRHALQPMQHVLVYPNQEATPPDSFDLVISNDPDDATKPAKTQWMIAHVPSDLQDLITIESQSNQAIDWRRDLPILQHVDLSNVLFMDQPIASDNQKSTFLNRGYEVLMDGVQGPLMLESYSNNQHRFIATFDLDRSMMPYRVCFPVFLSNLVEIARQEAGLSEAKAVATGQLPAMTASPNQSVRVTGPDTVPSLSVTADTAGLLPGPPSPKTGLYHFDPLNETVGASLLSIQETTLEQMDSVSFREARITAEESPVKVDRPIWHILAALALLVLLIEWWAFQRRPGGWRTPSTTS